MSSNRSEVTHNWGLCCLCSIILQYMYVHYLCRGACGICQAFVTCCLSPVSYLYGMTSGILRWMVSRLALRPPVVGDTDVDKANQQEHNQREDEVVIAQLIKTNEVKTIEYKNLRRQYDELQKSFVQLELAGMVEIGCEPGLICSTMVDNAFPQSDELTTAMADVLSRDGHLENADDKYSPTKVAKRFHDIYDTLWFEMLDKYPSEIKGIIYLTRVIKNCYESCKKIADRQISELLVCGDGYIPSFREFPDIYQVRRKYGVRDTTIDRVVQNVLGELLRDSSTCTLSDVADDVDTDTDNGRRKALEQYITECTRCCWLLLISTPPLKLKFDVLGKPISQLKTYFTEYSSNEPIVDLDKEKGYIVHVVWPAVTTIAEDGIYQKGDVLTVSNSTEPAKSEVRETTIN